MMLIDLARLTLQSPRKGLRAVLSLNLPFAAGLGAVALMAVGSALLLHLSLALMPMPAGNPLFDALASSPFRTALVQGAMLLGTAGLVLVIGRALGGRGTAGQAVLAMAWLQAFFVALQAAQVVALLVFPPLSAVIGLVSIGLFLWLMTQFVAELHGFASGWKVLFGLLLTALILSFALSFLLVMALGPEAFQNV